MAFQEALAHIRVDGPDGNARPFAPFIWRNVAFDPFNLSPSAHASTGVRRSRRPDAVGHIYLHGWDTFAFLYVAQGVGLRL